MGTWLQEETLLVKSSLNTPLFNLVNSLIFRSARAKCIPFALAEVLVMLANNWSPPRPRLLALETTEPAEEAIKLINNDVQIDN